jgi:hypothetical protein
LLYSTIRLATDNEKILRGVFFENKIWFVKKQKPFYQKNAILGQFYNNQTATIKKQ